MDVGRAVGNNRSYSYSALFHPLALACRNVWTLPDPDTAGDLAPPHAVAQRLREDHLRTLASSPSWAAPRAVGCRRGILDRKSTRLNSSHTVISYAVFCLKKKKIKLHGFLISLPHG